MWGRHVSLQSGDSLLGAQRPCLACDRGVLIGIPRYLGCAIARAEPHVERRRGDFYKEHRRQTVDEITHVGPDAHGETTAIAVAEAGSHAPRFIGTGGPKLADVSAGAFGCH